MGMFRRFSGSHSYLCDRASPNLTALSLVPFSHEWNVDSDCCHWCNSRTSGVSTRISLKFFSDHVMFSITWITFLVANFLCFCTEAVVLGVPLAPLPHNLRDRTCISIVLVP